MFYALLVSVILYLIVFSLLEKNV
ncbi:hypothetical protein KL86DPRO_20281 [uncultured delta proteobacterium]|uniref:Uncharacterized protein n=1 Tax=uncultured delta proteobacterium TaxID=34034 RepID=A0A212JXU3_9DELT|nr:hypothetical protein KL86DPRO_20281 [uncultured delta proteobacterium]